MIHKSLMVAALLSTALLFGCKKEIDEASSANIPTGAHVFRYKETIAVPAEELSQGYLKLTVSSDNEAFLKEYIENLKDRKLVLKEADPAADKENPPHIEANHDPTKVVSIHMDWSEYTFSTEKGKMYAIGFVPKDGSKTLTLVNTLPSITSYSTTAGFGAVTVYNTHTYYYVGCLCMQSNNTASWSYSNSSGNIFYSSYMNRYDNLEVRMFTLPYVLNTFGNFTIGGTRTYYRPRLNYTSPEMPYDYTDVNAIFSGTGSDPFNGGSAEAQVRFYIAG